jgi:hypothetical protein
MTYERCTSERVMHIKGKHNLIGDALSQLEMASRKAYIAMYVPYYILVLYYIAGCLLFVT